MVTFDGFSAYDGEKDIMRFRCYYGEKLVLCGVTRAALVAGRTETVSTVAELGKLYESRLQIIQRAVLHRLEGPRHHDSAILIIDVEDVYRLAPH